ncbi:MAG: CDP-diacylglycerol--serine O-phosphatidyltransferase [Bacteroidota bacterium]
MKIKDHVPNSITLLNLLCGCLAIVAAFKYDLALASILIFIGGFFDYVDGTVARLLDARSDLGKQLDSLADVVTFGVVPGIIVYQLLNEPSLTANYPFIANNIAYISGIPFLLTLFSAVRLAKFNIDERQTISFLGLPTPANAIFWASIPLIFKSIDAANIPHGIIEHIESLIYLCFRNPYVLLSLSVIMSFCLVLEIPLFSLKFKSLKWADNKTRYLFILTSILLIVFFNVFALPIIIILYIVFSVVNNIFL